MEREVDNAGQKFTLSVYQGVQRSFMEASTWLAGHQRFGRDGLEMCIFPFFVDDPGARTPTKMLGS